MLLASYVAACCGCTGCRHSCNQGLLQLVAQGAAEYLQGAPAPTSAPEGSSPLKVSLFSLGNMCTHRECAQELLMLNIRGVVAPLAASQDATVRRYVERIEVCGGTHGVLQQYTLLVQAKLKARVDNK